MQSHTPTWPLRGDEADLFARHHLELWHEVRRRVRGPDALIDDACAQAWLKLLRFQPHRETVVGWLITTATRSAWDMSRLGRELPAVALNGSTWEDGRGSAPGPHPVVEARDQLRHLRELIPPRQRRVLALHALGLSYHEIAARERCSWLTVNRQLVRARARARAAA